MPQPTRLQPLEDRLLLSATSLGPIQDRLTYADGPAIAFDLDRYFDDDDVDGTVVRMRSVLGNIDVELFDSVTPETVENFLRYVDSGRYDDSFIHRAVDDFVLQGGGFNYTADFGEIADFGTIDNEYNNYAYLSGANGTIGANSAVMQVANGTDLSGVQVGDRIKIVNGDLSAPFVGDVTAVNDGADTITLSASNGATVLTGMDWHVFRGDLNTRGTLAMAKLGSSEDSATSEFFINLNNNSANLDYQNGGFVPFARVLGNGMTVADNIESLFKDDFSTILSGKDGASAYTDLPVRNYTQTDYNNSVVPDNGNLALFNDVSRVSPLTYTLVSNSSPSLVSVSFNERGEITVTPQAGQSGTATITIRATAYDNTTVDQSFTVTVKDAAAPMDYNGDGRADLLFRNTADGRHTVRAYNGTTQISQFRLRRLNDMDWTLTGTGDFDNNGTEDLLFRNDDGRNTAWLFDEGAFQGAAQLPRINNSAVEVGGIGDFDGDGDADLWLRNTTFGRNTLWTMNGTNLVSSRTFNYRSASWWEPAGAGDFNADGIDDMLFRRNDNGDNSVALLNGNGNTQVASTVLLQRLNNQDWTVGHIGDYTGDGLADIVWRRKTDGKNTVWRFEGTEFIEARAIDDLLNADWVIPAFGA